MTAQILLAWFLFIPPPLSLDRYLILESKALLSGQPGCPKMEVELRVEERWCPHGSGVTLRGCDPSEPQFPLPVKWEYCQVVAMPDSWGSAEVAFPEARWEQLGISCPWLHLGGKPGLQGSAASVL